MNTVNLIGNLTRDPEVRYTLQNLAVCTFTIAINRGRDKDGNDRGADFPRVTVYGKTAENCGKYLAKGRKVGIAGRLQTGSYTKQDGTKLYTTDVIAHSVEFLSSRSAGGSGAAAPVSGNDIPEGFEEITDDDIPF